MPKFDLTKSYGIAKILQEPLLATDSDKCGCNEACGCKKDNCCEYKCACDSKSTSSIEQLILHPDYADFLEGLDQDEVNTVDKFLLFSQKLRGALG